jgi:hypothetical protein
MLHYAGICPLDSLVLGNWKKTNKQTNQKPEHKLNKLFRNNFTTYRDREITARAGRHFEERKGKMVQSR